MYRLIQDKNNIYKFKVYLNHFCEFDIHYICKQLLKELDVVNNQAGGEYVVRRSDFAEIYLYH